MSAESSVHSSPGEESSRQALPRQALLRQALSHAEHFLPAQAPLEVFVHHNTLHSFESLPFFEALAVAARRLRARMFLPERTYRSALQQGRIAESDLRAVLATMTPFQATGSGAGKMVHSTPIREQAPQAGPPECRMFELALADEIEVRLPKSWSAAPYLAPIAMVGYDFEPATGPDSVPRIAVRVAPLLARGDGKVLRTISTVARADYATRVPTYQERTSQEVAQELTEQIARGLSQNLRSAAPRRSACRSWGRCRGRCRWGWR